LNELKEQVRRYLNLCKEYIKMVTMKEPEIKNWKGDLIDGYNALWDTILSYLDDLREYIEARKKVISEFEAHLFWMKQLLETNNVGDASFYLKQAMEDLVDMKSAAIIEKEVAERIEEQTQFILKLMEGVKATKRRVELFEKYYPQLEKMLEKMICMLKG